MAGALRVLLWVLVLLAPGGILLAPLLAAHELRRRNASRVGAAPGELGVSLARVSRVPSQL